MSLYNMVFGSNNMAPVVMALLGAEPERVGRMRDAWIAKDEECFTLAVYTRMGGGNREHYAEAIAYLRSLPGFLRDADDDFDSTYATFFYDAPEEYAALVKEAYEKQPDRYTQLTASERWEQAIGALKGGK